MSIRSRAGVAAGGAGNGGQHAAAGACDAGQLGEPGVRVGEVVEHERGDGVVDGLGGQRQRAISATAPGGRAAASQASMPKDRSMAMGLAGWAARARLAAPVAAPASGTVWSASGAGWGR